jgi:hypothetical protein
MLDSQSRSALDVAKNHKVIEAWLSKKGNFQLENCIFTKRCETQCNNGFGAETVATETIVFDFNSGADREITGTKVNSGQSSGARQNRFAG